MAIISTGMASGGDTEGADFSITSDDGGSTSGGSSLTDFATDVAGAVDPTGTVDEATAAFESGAIEDSVADAQELLNDFLSGASSTGSTDTNSLLGGRDFVEEVVSGSSSDSPSGGGGDPLSAAQDWINSITSTSSDPTADAEEAAQDAISNVDDLAGDFFGGVTDVAGDVGDAGGDLVSGGVGAAQDVVNTIVGGAADVAGDVGGTVGGTAADVLNGAQDAVNQMVGAFGDLLSGDLFAGAAPNQERGQEASRESGRNNMTGIGALLSNPLAIAAAIGIGWLALSWLGVVPGPRQVI